MRFVGSWSELILRLSGGITQHGGIASADKLALADIIDCVKWDISSIFQIPGRTISVVLDLESTFHYTLHLDFTNWIMDEVSVDPWSVLGRSLRYHVSFRVPIEMYLACIDPDCGLGQSSSGPWLNKNQM